ncbi:MAG: phosphatase PAP2 family protein [Candidatus Riflebacteria bacterium]
MLEALISLDHYLFMLFNSGITFSFLDWFMPFITNAKTWVPIIVLSWLVLLIAGDRRLRLLGLALLVSVGLSDLVCARIIKPMVGRQRPCSLETGKNFQCRLLLPKKSSKSFPSNHSANTAAFAATVLFFVGLKASLPFVLLAFLIGYSRVYCGVHFPVDVVAGWLAGAMLGYLSARFFLRFVTPPNQPDQPAVEEPA